MADRVWPVDAADCLRMRTFNGFGTGLRGFTRLDASGRQFATAWLMVVWFPLVPLRRYYLRRVSERHELQGIVSQSTTSYQIAGESAIRPVEVLLTWLFSLLAVAAVVVPSAVLLSYADQIVAALPGQGGGAVVAVIALLLCTLAGSIVLIVVVQTRYRKRWAPLRAVHWLERRPVSDWESWASRDRTDTGDDAW